jgi:hypothetical protein
MLMRWRRHMNLLTVESLRNIDQFAKQIWILPPSYRTKSVREVSPDTVT